MLIDPNRIFELLMKAKNSPMDLANVTFAILSWKSENDSTPTTQEKELADKAFNWLHSNKWKEIQKTCESAYTDTNSELKEFELVKQEVCDTLIKEKHLTVKILDNKNNEILQENNQEKQKEDTDLNEKLKFIKDLQLGTVKSFINKEENNKSIKQLQYQYTIEWLLTARQIPSWQMDDYIKTIQQDDAKFNFKHTSQPSKTL